MRTDLVPLPSWSSDLTWATFPQGTFHQDVLGVECQKSADDLERYRTLIEESQPDIVIETGTRNGGSALWFLEQGLDVITIDLMGGAGQAARDTPRGHEIWFYTGHSSAELPFEILCDIFDHLRGKRVMVSLDSDHHTPHVGAEIAVWAPMVSPGCYLVIEDACFDMWDADRARVGGARIPELGGPLPAIQERADDLETWGFWRDENLEGLTPVSHSPVGWWRRRD